MVNLLMYERHIVSPATPPTLPAEIEVLDERFRDCRGDAWIERIFSGGRWTEGPVYLAAGRYLVWSDIPNDRMLRWDEMTGHVGLFRSPTGYTNGNTLDRDGRLISCEHAGRCVSRTEHDGSRTVLASAYRGKRLNSPNDVVVKSDGSIWFTDPSYGIDSDYEGVRADGEIGGCYVYRIDPGTGAVELIADDFVRPNGLAFSSDERRLYIVDTRRNHIRVFDVVEGRALRGGDVFASCSVGVFDGIRLDASGRIWAAAGDGVHCFAADGTLVGKLRLPEEVSNLVFGGLKRNHLFVTATTSVYSIRLHVNGAGPTRM
jgi:gluconolactonase